MCARILGICTERILLERRVDQGGLPRDPPGAGLPRLPRPHGESDPVRVASSTGQAGVTLTESFAMWPASSVSGWYFAHPEARYFGLGRIERDQVEDYARRKDMPVETVEKWLAPNLAYDPEGRRSGRRSFDSAPVFP